MLVWRKLSSQKWLDSWEERLAFLGSERLVVTQIAQTKRIRLEIFNVSKDESKLLLQQFAGEIRDLNHSTADWISRVVQKEPISIRNRLKIVNGKPNPSKHSDSKVIYIPANLAFGTGKHTTTAGCLRLLVDIAPLSGSWTLLDAGTGTGILGIAAVRLGAKQVIGFDFDPTAIRIAKENVRLNKIRNLKLFRADVLKYQPKKLLNIVVANLYSDIFYKAAPNLWRALRPGGSMIISGVMRDQIETVVQAVNKLSGKIRILRIHGKWATLLADKALQNQGLSGEHKSCGALSSILQRFPDEE
jgi:ribosomal protein L11 methyltransferase